MTTLYTHRFLQLAHHAAGTITYTVPPTNTVVLRDMDLYRGPRASGPSVGFSIENAIGGVIFASIAPLSISNMPYHWEGRQVLEATESLTVRLFDDDWSVMISGYLFSS